MFLFIKKTNLANFVDDNTIFAASKDMASLLEELKFESEGAINWFETNHVFSNPDKVQTIVVQYKKNIRTTP